MTPDRATAPPLAARRRSARKTTGVLGRYARGDLRPDAFAGLIVALVGVPQAMAYAMIADLPPTYGLYTAIATCIVGALLGSSSHLIIGPTNASCMVILSLIAPFLSRREVHPLEIVLLLTFMTGLIQLVFGLLRFGGLVRYVSNSVVVGFTAGAGILIAANQLRNLLGVEVPPTDTARLHEVLVATLRRLPEMNPYTLAIGLITAVTAILVPRVLPRFPGSLVGITLAAVLSWLLGWHRPEMGALRIDIVRDIQPIHANLLKMFHVPRLLVPLNLGLARELGTGALALAILGFIEATSIARTVASSSGQRLDYSRQFVGQGAANVVGSFFSCFVGSGSPTRTVLCYRSGGRTRMAPVFSALWTALIVVVLAPLANLIPKAALAGLLVVIAYSMIDKRRLRLTWKTGAASRIVLFGTLASTLIFPIQYAVFVGVILSILILLQITGQTDLTQLVPRADSGFDEVPFNRAPSSPVVTINLEGDLYFAAVEDLDHELLRALTDETRVVVLRMKRLRAVGSTAMAILEHFWELLRRRGIQLVVCGIEDELKQVMTGSGLREQIGEENIFYADNKLLQSTELAQARARSIVEGLPRPAATSGEATAPPAPAGIVAGDIMTRHCIRFGNQHQLREAVWLLAEMQKRLEPSLALALFLQDREGKLAGELTVWRLLRELKRDLETSRAADVDDREVGVLFRKHFTRPIGAIARTDLPRLTERTTLAELLLTSIETDLPVLPVCNEDGRVLGLIDQNDLLTGLAKALAQCGEEVRSPE
jgi:SulP family sulfate permease